MASLPLDRTRLTGFTTYLRERLALQRRREAGAPRPWTEDPILHRYKFCCVYRDDDRTSREARAVVTALPPGEQLRALLGFRLYNRVKTLENLITSGWSPDVFRSPLLQPSFNTLAYKINLPGGLYNREAVIRKLEVAAALARSGWRPRPTAKETWTELRATLGVGPFLVYQTVLDLRWLYGPYTDEMSWCCYGPGGVRGLARLLGKYVPIEDYESYRVHYRRHDYDPYRRDVLGVDLIGEAQGILEAVREEFPFTLFDVQGNLCEFDKYERIRTNEGKSRIYNPREE
jgi:hypothetical protein